MKIEFISNNLWPQLTKAARSSPQPCAVAVAYFGAGASRLLPLPKGSQLVVDASERSVASGQTCPADLINLKKRGVSIYSVSNLHAKVFVLGRSAYIGSSNASSRSAMQLVEAAIHTSKPSAVLAARNFVEDHCLHELTPMLLDRLAKLYRPPKFKGNKPGPGTSNEPSLPPVFLAQLALVEWSEQEQALHDRDLATAKKRRKHGRGYELQSFRVRGKCIYQIGDVVIQVTEEWGPNGALVSPPGNVVHVPTHRAGNKQTSFVYLELPDRRRRPVSALARQLGYSSQNVFYRDGRIKDSSFARSMLRIWAVNR